MAEQIGSGLQTHLCRCEPCPWLHIKIKMGNNMSQKSVEETFEALFALTDLRQIFRETKPTYKLNDEQKEKVRKIIESVRKNLLTIEEELAK